MQNKYLTIVLMILTVLLTGCDLGRTPVPEPVSDLALSTVTPMPQITLTITKTEEIPSPTPIPPAFPTLILTPTPTTVSLPPPTTTPLPIITITPSPANTNTPILIPTPTPSPSVPYAIITTVNLLNVRSGPGQNYNPPLGAYSKGDTVNIIGKQYSTNGELWWLVPFNNAPQQRGWIYAGYTQPYNINNVPFVVAPPTPVFPTPTPPPPPDQNAYPHAVINSPTGSIYVRSIPNPMYNPPLGVYNNGAVVKIIGKQYGADNAIWWLIPFATGQDGTGWIYADFTIARYFENVPWIIIEPPPTVTPAPGVEWIITGQVVDTITGQVIKGAVVMAELGQNNQTVEAVTDINGGFHIKSNAQDNGGELRLIINANGYAERVIVINGVRTPRIYNLSIIDLVPSEKPVVAWAVFGRVMEIGTANPITNARVEAILGVDAVQVEAFTDANGKFALNSQAHDEGILQITITADGYRPASSNSDQTSSRVYNLPDVQLVPIASSCSYESVIDLTQNTAIARLQSLSFTTVSTSSIIVNNNPELLGRVLSQEPNPPANGQTVQVNCNMPIILRVGDIGVEIQ